MPGVVGIAGSLLAVMMCASMASASQIWMEDFDSSSDWVTIFNAQGGGAGVTSQTGVGYFYVDAPNNEVAFGPDPGVPSLFIPFSPVVRYAYEMYFSVTDLTGSTSYDIRLDEFDTNHNYLATVYNIFPQGTFVGSTNINLWPFNFHPQAAYLLPKVTVFTGLGNQEVAFDNMSFDYNSVPEPTTAVLMVLGVWSLSVYRKKQRQAQGRGRRLAAGARRGPQLTRSE